MASLNGYQRSIAEVGLIYRYDKADSECRLGDCDWLPDDQDICLCVAHSGDCFHTYIALRPTANGFVKHGKFGAYGLGEPIGRVDERSLHLAQAGEAIYLP